VNPAGSRPCLTWDGHPGPLPGRWRDCPNSRKPRFGSPRPAFKPGRLRENFDFPKAPTLGPNDVVAAPDAAQASPPGRVDHPRPRPRQAPPQVQGRHHGRRRFLGLLALGRWPKNQTSGFCRLWERGGNPGQTHSGQSGAGWFECHCASPFYLSRRPWGPKLKWESKACPTPGGGFLAVCVGAAFIRWKFPRCFDGLGVERVSTWLLADGEQPGGLN